MNHFQFSSRECTSIHPAELTHEGYSIEPSPTRSSVKLKGSRFALGAIVLALGFSVSIRSVGAETITHTDPGDEPVCAAQISFDKRGAFLHNGSLNGQESHWVQEQDVSDDPDEPQYWARRVYIVNADGCGEALRIVLANQPPNTLLQKLPQGHGSTYVLRHALGHSTSSKHIFQLQLLRGSKVIDTHEARLNIRDTWGAAMVSGAGLAVYRPDGSKAEHHTWTGVHLEYILGTWKNDVSDSGPGFGKVLINTSILSTEARDDLTIKYGFGYRVSWEDRTARHFLIPYYGLDFGGIYGPQGTQTHHSFQITPTAGIALMTTKSISLTAAGGYVLPLSESLEAQRGWSGNIGLNIHLW